MAHTIIFADVEPQELTEKEMPSLCLFKEELDSGCQSCSSHPSSPLQLHERAISTNELSLTLSTCSSARWSTVEDTTEVLTSADTIELPPLPKNTCISSSLSPVSLGRNTHLPPSLSPLPLTRGIPLPPPPPPLPRGIPLPPPPLPRGIPLPPPPPPLPRSFPTVPSPPRFHRVGFTHPPLLNDLAEHFDPDIHLSDFDYEETQSHHNFTSLGDCLICRGDVYGNAREKEMVCCGALVCDNCKLIHIKYHPSETKMGTISCPNTECSADFAEFAGMGPEISIPLGECIVCYEELTRYSKKRECCSELVCAACMKEIIRTNIEVEGRTYITCPNPECDGLITHKEVLKYADTPTMDKYERLYLKESGSKSRKTCPNCCEITHHKLPRKLYSHKENDLLITCTKCSHKWCFYCHAPWHEGLSCREFQKGDKLFKKWTKHKNRGKINCQKCPLCRVYIQKSSGCNHMTCNRCNTSFCYRCGGFYRLDIPGIGGHNRKTSILGCKYNYEEDDPVRRRAVRGGYFGAKLAMLTGYPILFLAGLGVVVLVGVVALPIYAGYRYHKYRKNVRRQYSRRKII